MVEGGAAVKPAGGPVNAVYDAKHFCGVLKLIAPYIAVKVNDASYVIAEDALAKVGESLDFDDVKIKAIFKTLVSVGMLHKVTDPDRKKDLISVTSIEKMESFLSLLRTTHTRKTQKLLEHHFADKTLRLAKALIQYAKTMNLSAESKITLTGDELDKRLTKVTNTTFERPALSSLIELELLEYQQDEDPKLEKLLFIPQKLNRALMNVSAYKRFERLDLAAAAK
jgi:hypothetical protein